MSAGGSVNLINKNNKNRIENARINREKQLKEWSIYEKNYPKQQKAFTKPAKPNKIHFNKDVMIYEAVTRNDRDEVTKLLEEGANPNAVNVDGLSGLHQCCIDNFVDMARLLIKYKADVNIPDLEMWTPLHAAATCGRTELVQLLSQNGGNLLAMNTEGNMPYDICEGEKCLNLIETEMGKKNISQNDIDTARQKPEKDMLFDLKQLKRTGYNFNELDSQGANLLHVATSLGFEEVVRYLLDEKVEVCCMDKDGWMAIHIAAYWNFLTIVELLVTYGAEVDDEARDGSTVFDICDPEVVPKLKDIQDNTRNLRNVNKRRVSEYRSFRKSRNTSIRRLSMKQKNALTRNEAKGEYTEVVTSDTKLVTGSSNEQKSSDTVDDDSDVDNHPLLLVEINPQINKQSNEGASKNNTVSNNEHNSPPMHKNSISIQNSSSRRKNRNLKSSTPTNNQAEVETVPKNGEVTRTNEDNTNTTNNANYNNKKSSKRKCCTII